MATWFVPREPLAPIIPDTAYSASDFEPEEQHRSQSTLCHSPDALQHWDCGAVTAGVAVVGYSELSAEHSTYL